MAQWQACLSFRPFKESIHVSVAPAIYWPDSSGRHDVPFTLDASLPLAELAQQVEARVSQCRQQRIDLSQFRFLETAISRRWVGKVDDPVSYAITSVSNHRLNKAPHTLPGARFVEMLGAVNAQPRDEMGGLNHNGKSPGCAGVTVEV